jgi:hypothetical protein
MLGHLDVDSDTKSDTTSPEKGSLQPQNRQKSPQFKIHLDGLVSGKMETKNPHISSYFMGFFHMINMVSSRFSCEIH